MAEVTKAQAAIRAGDVVRTSRGLTGTVVQVVRNEDGSIGAYVRLAGEAKAWKFQITSLSPWKSQVPGGTRQQRLFGKR